MKTLAKVRFTASGTCDGDYAPSFAVLNGPNCWCPTKSHCKNKEWLQIDLGRVLTVQGFETQGHPSHGGHWCKTLRCETSIDGNTDWKNEGTFPANTNPNDVTNMKLKKERYARYVRFFPQQCGGGHGGWGKLRVEIFWTEPLNYVPPTTGEYKHTGETKNNGDAAAAAAAAAARKDKSKTPKELRQELGLPEYPGTVVTLSTELVRLRGGPYWSESYALLRATGRATLEGSPGTPLLCVVDHVTDGGRWILLGSWQSDCTRMDSTGRSLPKRVLGPVGHAGAGVDAADTEKLSFVTNVNQFGVLMGADFAALERRYNQKTVVSEVRVFGCSLKSERIVHYKTSRPQLLVDVQRNLLSLCQHASHHGTPEGTPGDDYQTLPGHHRFGSGRFTKHCHPTHGCCCSPCFDPVARCTGCCASEHGMSVGVKNVEVGLVS